MMSLLDNVLGALHVGTWVNCCLWTIELQLVVYYFFHYRRDNPLLKLMVLTVILADTLATASNCFIVYDYSVTRYGDLTALYHQGWPFNVYVVTTGICASITQGYLTWRFYSVSKSILFTVPLVLLSLTAEIFNIWTCYALANYQNLAQRDKLLVVATVCVVIELAADICISGALLICLWRLRAKTPFTQTNRLLAKLMLLSAESGTFTTILSIAKVASFLPAPETNTAVGIGFTLGRMYSLTFLLNLLIRGRIGKDGSWLSSGSINASGGSNTIVMPRSLGHIESGPMNDSSNGENGMVKVGFRGVKVDKYTEVYDENDDKAASMKSKTEKYPLQEIASEQPPTV